MNTNHVISSISIVALVSLNACSNLAEHAPNKSTPIIHQTLSVDFSWKNISRCLGSSPQFTLDNIPENTHTLDFTLRDIYFPFFPHGGGQLTYTGGNIIPEGTVKAAKGHYIGPCAPPFFPGQYKFFVEALDRDGVLLGKGEATRPFPHR